MSELAEREVKETSVFWRDCCMQMCLPVAASNTAAGLEQMCVMFLAPLVKVSMLSEGNNRHMVARLRVGEYVYPTCLRAAR